MAVVRQATAWLPGLRARLPQLHSLWKLTASPAQNTILAVMTRPSSSAAAASPAQSEEGEYPAAIFPGSGLATYAGAQALGSGWKKLVTGLQIKDLSVGRGPRPKPGEQVTVHYTALDNNTDKLYECTFQSGKPAIFNLNEGWVYSTFLGQKNLAPAS